MQVESSIETCCKKQKSTLQVCKSSLSCERVDWVYLWAESKAHLETALYEESPSVFLAQSEKYCRHLH